MSSSYCTIVELLDRVAHSGQQGGGVLQADKTGNWVEYRWQDVAALACRAVDSLSRRGVGSGDRVAIAAGNSLAWIVTDFAVQMLGGVVVPLATSLSKSQLDWQVEHSRSQLVLDAAGANELLATGNEAPGRLLWKQTQEAVTPQTLASIVYTSGTSGEPKGVMLTQGNLASNALDTLAAFDGRPQDLRLNMLPFSHAYGRMSDLYVSLAGNTRLAISRGRDKVVSDAQQTGPTLLVVVPLVLTRLREAAIAQFGEEDPQAVNKLLGGNVRGFICGGARLPGELFDYFQGQRTPVWEGYGLTEASPIVSLSSEHSCRRSTVGRGLPNTMLQIAADGELLIAGPQVMAGYWRDSEATDEVLKNGWLHTGDLAFCDDGFLVLQGRKKDFIALASGKKVWPAKVEEKFTGDPFIEQIMVVGEGRAALGALVVCKRALFEAGGELNSAANRRRILDYLAEKLQLEAGHQQIRHVWLLDQPWTVEQGELTPKHSLRRSVLLARYADCVRAMYD